MASGEFRNQKGTTVPESETMPSTDIDGSVIVILSTEEAQYIYDHLMAERGPYPKLEQQIIHKIARDLKLEQPKEQSEEQPEKQPEEQSDEQLSNL